MERTNDKITEKEWYRRKIVEMVEGIDSEAFLRFLYEMLCSFKRKWGI